jgi:hypothetical protein
MTSLLKLASQAALDFIAIASQLAVLNLMEPFSIGSTIFGCVNPFDFCSLAGPDHHRRRQMSPAATMRLVGNRKSLPVGYLQSPPPISSLGFWAQPLRRTTAKSFPWPLSATYKSAPSLVPGSLMNRKVLYPEMNPH